MNAERSLGFRENPQRLVIVVNRMWLKIIGCMVFVFGVVVLGYVFWPAGTSARTEAEGTGHIQEEVDHGSAAQIKARRPATGEPKRAIGLAGGSYRRTLLRNKSTEFPRRGQQIAKDAYRKLYGE